MTGYYRRVKEEVTGVCKEASFRSENNEERKEKEEEWERKWEMGEM